MRFFPHWRTAVFSSLLLAGLTVNAEFQDTAERKSARRETFLQGRSVQIDTTFPYYQNRSGESIAHEIRVNGFDAVFYILMRPEQMREDVGDALKSMDIGLGIMTAPAQINFSPADLDTMLPANWREWQVKFTRPSDPYTFIGLVYPEYNAWYKDFLHSVMRRMAFDAFTFAEIHFPIYNGLEQNPIYYGDISENFQKAFLAATGAEFFPDFTNPEHPNFYKKHPEIYQKLVEFRVNAVNSFYNDIVNGKNGMREHYPDIVFATWTLGSAEPDALTKLREWEGNDVPGMIKAVRPDIHYVQTHAPDWCDPSLPADYPLKYADFFAAIRTADAKVKIGLQSDFGSQGPMRRNNEWAEKFYKTCNDMNIDATTYYEFGLRSEIYDAAPELRDILVKDKQIWLIFDQRLAGNAPEILKNRELIGRWQQKYKIVNAEWDGNIVKITTDRQPRQGEAVTLDISGLQDDPSVRFAWATADPNRGGQGQINTVPENTVVTLMVR